MDRKLQVFVSSTFTDLIEERQAAVSAILKSGHMPAGMELFTAGDKSQWDTITKWIDESDVYLLILGGRYGSIEPESGLSYTELEYDYAISKGKPHFAIVSKESAIEAKVKNRGIGVLERDNPALLKAFRTKVTGKMSSFFEDEKDIRLAVMESLMHISNLNASAGWVRASSVVDPKSLNDTIVQLRDENTQLSNTIKKLEAPGKARKGYDEFEELKLVLSRTMVNLPGENASKSLDVLAVSSLYLDSIVRGVSSGAAGEVTTWLYQSVLPKLILHGLAEAKRPSPSAVYFLSQLNQDGLRFFSRLKREAAA